MRADTGGTVRVRDSAALGSVVLQSGTGVLRAHEVRLTFPHPVPVPTVEAALADAQRSLPGRSLAAPPLALQVADISVTSWDGGILLWTTDPDEAAVRDRVLRSLLPRLRAPAPAAVRSA